VNRLWLLLMVLLASSGLAQRAAVENCCRWQPLCPDDLRGQGRKRGTGAARGRRRGHGFRTALDRRSGAFGPLLIWLAPWTFGRPDRPTVQPPGGDAFDLALKGRSGGKWVGDVRG